MRTNPWGDLPHSAPFVLPSDASAIHLFNSKAKPQHIIHLEIVPEPFLGNPHAPVVLLNKNPGFREHKPDAPDPPVHEDPVFNAAAIANLAHRHETYPFYLLDPALPCPGQMWWLPKLRPLTEKVGLRKVASSVFVAEIHGYHSVEFNGRLDVPSQAYTRCLVLEAIERQSMIVVMRGWREWQELVPELSALGTVIFLKNPQTPHISPGNCPEAFERILDRLESAG